MASQAQLKDQAGISIPDVPDGQSPTELLRYLVEQVISIADILKGTQGSIRTEPSSATFNPQRQNSESVIRRARPPLPDPPLLRRIIRQRQLRGRFFNKELFADPAWDMLLDLAAARAEHKRVSITSLCLASGVPSTTALRWIAQLTAAGLLQRVPDETDRRRAFITLTDHAADAMARYFEALQRMEPGFR